MDEERALDPCWCGASYVLEDKTFSKHALHYGYIKKRFTCTSGHDIIVDMGRVVEVDIIPDIKKTQKAQEQNKDRKYTKPKPHFTKICQYCQKKMHRKLQMMYFLRRSIPFRCFIPTKNFFHGYTALRITKWLIFIVLKIFLAYF